MHEHDRGRAILRNEPKQLGRVRRIERHIGRTRLQDAQHGSDGIARTLGIEADFGAGLHAPGDQSSRDDRSAPRKFRVGDRRSIAANCRMVGPLAGDGGKDFMNRAVEAHGQSTL